MSQNANCQLIKVTLETKKINTSEVFIEYSNNTDDIYKNIEKHYLNKNKNIDCI